MKIEIAKSKNDVEFRLDQIVADPNYDYSKLTLEELLAVRAHAQSIAVDGSLEFHTRRQALSVLMFLEDALQTRIQAA